jgi:hypothetical protein
VCRLVGSSSSSLNLPPPSSAMTHNRRQTTWLEDQNKMFAVNLKSETCRGKMHTKLCTNICCVRRFLYLLTQQGCLLYNMLLLHGLAFMHALYLFDPLAVFICWWITSFWMPETKENNDKECVLVRILRANIRPVVMDWIFIRLEAIWIFWTHDWLCG